MTVRDCLYLNWALPVDSLPAPVAPLRYQVHPWQGRDYTFASALLFHQDAVHLSALPLFHFGYPQLNLRLCVLDDAGVPSVLFHRMLMPAWVVPGIRLMTHQPAVGARLDFPRPSQALDDGPWLWRVERGGALEVRAWQDSPRTGEGPRIGSWEQTVRYFSERPRAYAESAGVLHKIDARQPPADGWPLRVELSGEDLLGRLLPLGRDGNGAVPWPALHSAWLCPEIPVAFELGQAREARVAPGMRQPAAGRVVSLVLGQMVAHPSAPPETRQIAPAERQRMAC